ncbi:hypothetical protein CARUB_v10024793mg [Capsella rubella]|uniref:Nuclear speckle splicing regulatory protein 1 N-terminal domain-containing protein n=1 Tax=Capsella rubella TaxID=81985 RepID=R0HT70_9BRAS|nr:hypothetical protein CARUB_v10024793mg [Capsella rubella]
MRPSALTFSARFDPSTPLGFLDKALDFIEKQSNFLRKDTAEKEITDAVTAAKERLKKEVEKVRPTTVPFNTSFDPTNPLGFLEKAFDFIGKESNFLRKDKAEKEIITAVMAAKERLKETEKKSVNLKKYGLQIRVPSQKKQSSSRPPLRTASIFGEDDEDNDVEKEISRQASKTKALKKIDEQHKKALDEDASAFSYDEVYDDIKHETLLPRIQDREEHKPRYIQHLMKQTERRKKEHEIVYERKLAKERAKDEHLYSDKEKFVTGSYKRKLEEQKKWLAEERLREIREEKDDVIKKKDLSDFYFNIGKNVAFGARDIEAKEKKDLSDFYFNIGKNVAFGARDNEAREAETFEDPRKEGKRNEKKRQSPENEVLPESGDIGSSCKKSVEPQAGQTTPMKKMDSERVSTIKEAAKEVPKASTEDAIAAAKERFLARKKAKIEESKFKILDVESDERKFTNFVDERKDDEQIVHTISKRPAL